MIWLAVVFALLLGAGSVALAALEAAFYLFRHRHLGHLTQQDRKAELVNRYLDDPAALLMPVHIGTYTAHVALTVIITALLLDLLAHWAVLVALVAMVVYLLAFRLMLPYALVRADPERALLRLVPVFHVYAGLVGPVVRSVRQRIGADSEADLEEPPAAGGSSAPEVPPPPVHEVNAIRVANSLARFSETQVREVMTPRPDIEAVWSGATVSELRRRFRESAYSRMPVYEENLDDIVGVVTVRDLVQYEGDPEAPARGLARPVFLAPETQRIAQLLKELQARGTTLAVVIDEYGGTAGLASVEDIVEELVGEIKDEYDVETEPIVVEPDGSFLVAGRLSLDRLEEALEIDLEDDSDVDTAGGLATTVFGHIPEVGETVAYQGFTIEVVEAERKRVNRLRFRRVPEGPSQ